MLALRSLCPGSASRVPVALAAAALLLPAWSTPAPRAAGAASRGAAEPVRGYYREPALHGDTIVFTAEGDLWTVGTSGGAARRLTSHPGDETHAAISPDGRTLAFSAMYEGPTEVYTMPLGGGLPVRRTWDGGDDAQVVGFTPDGQVLYTTRRQSTLPDWQLVALDLAGGASRVLPLSQAADGAWDRAGGTLFFTRPAFQTSHTRRYRGGTAQKVWALAPGAHEARPLTADDEGTSRQPMWWDGRVYFVSDRDGTLNLWSMAPDGGDLRQHTRHRGWDVASPSLDDGRIVYKLGADLRLIDLRTGDDRALDITLASDLDQGRERWISDPLEWLTAAHLSPKGERVVFTARGQVFVAPVKPGRFVEAGREPGVRYRQARFLGDGRRLSVLSDESGEVELWSLAADGVGASAALTRDGRVLRFDALPSPDGARIAFHDKNQELWIHDVARNTTRRIARSEEGPILDLAWSPDGRWLAYVAPTAASYQRIFICDAESGAVRPLTSERVDSFSPAWSPDGQWLYWLSDRNFQSLVEGPWGARQPEPYFDRMTRVYHVALPGDLRSPFRPPDELAPAKDEPRQGVASSGASGPGARGAGAARLEAAPEFTAGTAPKVAIAFERLEQRVEEVPVPPGNYESLSAGATRLFWLTRDTAAEPKKALAVLDLSNDAPQPKTLVEDVESYELSADGGKLLLRKGKDFHVLDAAAAAPASLDKTRLDLAAWKFPLDPREEWRQMFDEAWRLHRDYFYDPHMAGVDWSAMRAKYRPLVERLTDRRELSDLLAQMVSELSTLHTFVRGGDRRKGADQVEPGALGARLERDEAAGGVRVAHVYRSDPDYPERLSPLARPGVAVQDGDVILSVNGESALSQPDLGALLRNQGGRQVRLRVRAAGGGAERDVIATPLAPGKESDLRYEDWELSRRLEVEKLGGGRIGYVHLRAMGAADYAAFAREFYPVFDRQGLIVDVRHNRGGNIDSWILSRLLRRAWMFWQPRVGRPYSNMQLAFRGHMVVLVDEYTASDGELFAEGFRRLGLGRLIGTRTWGGEIWLTNSNLLVDKGIATAAEFAIFGPEGQWLIEGRGVEPDVVVDNLPRATFDGDDAQLRAAVEHLERLIRDAPVAPPAPPAYLDKSVPENRPEGSH